MDTQRQALLQRLHALIERRLGDPSLSPQQVATAHFISVRYLHKLFETERTTVAEWIRQRRLERCARDLLDPALAHEPVGEIVARWGITNPAHFSRLVRAQFGLSPSEYRAVERSRHAGASAPAPGRTGRSPAVLGLRKSAPTPSPATPPRPRGTILRDDRRRDMAGLTLGSGIDRIFPMGTSVRARRAVQVANYSRGRSGDSGAGFQTAG